MKEQRPFTNASSKAPSDDQNLLSSLAGKQARLDCAAAGRTRRVVLTSLGVMKEQNAHRKRNRSIAVAALLLILLAIGPTAWRLTDELIGGEHISDMTAQISLWSFVACTAALAAALVAGWLRKR